MTLGQTEKGCYSCAWKEGSRLSGQEEPEVQGQDQSPGPAQPSRVLGNEEGDLGPQEAPQGTMDVLGLELSCTSHPGLRTDMCMV